MAPSGGGKRTGFAVLLALLAMAILSGCAVTGTKIDKRTYAVYGETRAELKRDIRRRGPKGGSAYGLAVITFYPRYTVAQKGKVCRVTSAEVGMHAILTEPSWRGSKPARGSVARTWKRFSNYVRYHEAAHARIAKTHARRMKVTISKMSSSKGCADLRRKIDKRIKVMKRRHLAAQHGFDDREKRRIKNLI